jgi:epoxide hydrolase 4
LPLIPELALRAGNFAMLRRTLIRTSRPPAFRTADWPIYRDAWSQPGALGAMLGWYRALRRYARSLPPTRIRVPVRVIWGDRDAFLDRGLAAAGSALCDECEVLHLPEATHWLQHEEAETMNRRLIEFLR